LIEEDSEREGQSYGFDLNSSHEEMKDKSEESKKEISLLMEETFSSRFIVETLPPKMAARVNKQQKPRRRCESKSVLPTPQFQQYCFKVSLQEYESQKKESKTILLRLLQEISVDPKMTALEKSEVLKNVRKE